MSFHNPFLLLPCSSFRLIYTPLPNKVHILFRRSFPPPSFEWVLTFNLFRGSFYFLRFRISCKIILATSFVSLPIFTPIVGFVIKFRYVASLSCCFHLNNAAADENGCEKEEHSSAESKHGRVLKRFICTGCALLWALGNIAVSANVSLIDLSQRRFIHTGWLTTRWAPVSRWESC